MKLSEKQVRIALTFVGFIIIAVYVGFILATKYLVGGIAAGIVGLGVVIFWNKLSV